MYGALCVDVLFPQLGPTKHMETIEDELEKHLKVNTMILGPAPGQAREAHILNRPAAGCPPRGVAYEAYPWHTSRIVLDTGVGSLKTVGAQE